MQTVEPLAAARGLPVQAFEELAEGNGADVLPGLPGGLEATALCVHGDLAEEAAGEEVAKGSTTLLERTGTGLEVVATLPPPSRS